MTFGSDEARPVQQRGVDLFTRFLHVFREFYFFPHSGRECTAFRRLHIQVAYPFFLLDRGVYGVRQRAGGSVAQAGEVVFISAEIRAGRGDFVRAERVFQNTPHHIVALHFEPAGKLTHSSKLSWAHKAAYQIGRAHV